MIRRLLSLTIILITASSCSPLYVLKAGWKEAGILYRREPIEELLNNPQQATIHPKLSLVVAARKFATNVGLKPKGSFQDYSTVDGDVLVWVLNACPKSSLEPYTWWFPIVGSVPYKGFFDKESAEREAAKFERKGYDTNVRPSAAFSTLGWFNDPLLSTMIRFNDVSLANTVIHEILHNTIWVKNSVPFNESLANFVGGVAAIEFFKTLEGDGGSRTKIAIADWEDELIFAEFLDKLAKELDDYYQLCGKERRSKEQIIAGREQIGSSAKLRWQELSSKLRTKNYSDIDTRINNAGIVANRIYLTELPLFAELFELSDRSLPQFIKEVAAIAEEANNSGRDPFEIVKQKISHQTFE